MMTRLGRAILASVLLLLLGGVAVVAAADIGHKGIADPGGSAVTGSKPESKVWFNDGIWWASMQSSSSSGFWIYRLDTSTQTWTKTSTPLDNRNKTRADTLWDGNKLYVASQMWKLDGGATGTGTSFETRLYRFSYNSGTKTYSLDGGFPASMRSGIQSETLVIAKDSSNRLWATWTQKSGSANLVYVNHTTTSDATWSAPQVLPVGSQPVGVTSALDDISTIIAFTVSGQGRIGVLWTNQTDVKDYFAWRSDSADPDTAIWSAETAISSPGSSNPKPADDHVNIKADSSGRIYAVAKTSNSTGSQPLEDLIVRQPGGGWSTFTISTVGDSPTRAILELDESAGKLHVFETGPHNGSGSGQSGGDIYEKVSNTSGISFASGVGTPVMRANLGVGMNDVSSTKQNVNSTTGLVAIAFDDDADFYWHDHDTLGGGPPQDPHPAFTQDKTSGPAPLSVVFTNQSTGTGTLTYAWDFGDPTSGSNNASTQTDPTHVFSNPGSYTVKLTTTNGSSQSNTLTQTNLITATAPTATITLTPDADAQVKSDSATTNYGALTSVRTRTDPGTASTYKTFLRFNVSGLTGSVTGIKLRLFTSDASTDVQSVYPTLTNPNWIESGTGSITYTNAPTIGNAPLGSASVPALGAYNEITLNPSAISGNGLVTFALTSAGSNSAIFNSKEAGANPPQLVISQTTAPPNTSPTAGAASAATNEDTATPVALSGSDPETCELTFTLVTPPTKGTVNFAGQTPATCASGSPNTDSASVTYTPNLDANGPDSFTYKVTDGNAADSSPATASITINPVNDAPLAVGTSASTTVNTPTSVTLRGSDVDNCELASFTVITPPANGLLTLPTDNVCVAGNPNTDTQTITYTPNNGYVGGDTFTYRVNDGSLNSASDATATLTVTASNTAPTANDTSKTTNEDTAASVALSGADAETCELTFSLVTAPTKGTVNFAGQTPAVCAGTGPFTDSASVIYTPNANANGADSFTYRVNDGATFSAAATASITITPVNDAASANNVTTSTGQNVAKTITLSGSDIETCDLTFAFSQPGHGSVGSLSNNACAAGSPNTDSASIVYTPTNGYSGADSFTYTVDDGSGPSAAATVSITVTGGSPTTITLNPVADAHINSATASVTKNYGTLNPIRSREDPATPNTYRPYFQFNVPALSGSVSSVKLRVFVTTGSSSVTQSVYLVGNGWTETGINWSNAPVPSGSAIGSAVAGTSGAYVEFTLTTPVTSNSTISFALVSSGTSSVYFSTREDATNKPQLVIVSGP